MNKMFCKLKTKLTREEKGASAVEFALILPILVLLLFGIIQFGIAYNNYLAITHAAREGARLAAVGKYSEEIVRERAYPVNPTSITLNYPNGNNPGQPVEVEVSYPVTITIPLWGEEIITLRSKGIMRLE